MSEIYRVRYKRGDIELDIESSDKEYIDKKLAEIQSSTVAVATANVRAQRGNRSKGSTKTITSVDESLSVQAHDSMLAAIIATINDAEDYDVLAKRVLDQSDRTARILMCFYFAH